MIAAVIDPIISVANKNSRPATMAIIAPIKGNRDCSSATLRRLEPDFPILILDNRPRSPNDKFVLLQFGQILKYTFNISSLL